MITGETSTLSSGLNSIRLRPPNAAAYWSCLPIGSPQSSISTWQLWRPSSSGEAGRPWKAWRALIRPTVKELEEPRPVPRGDVGDGGDLDAAGDAHHLEGGAN